MPGAIAADVGERNPSATIRSDTEKRVLGKAPAIGAARPLSDEPRAAVAMLATRLSVRTADARVPRARILLPPLHRTVLPAVCGPSGAMDCSRLRRDESPLWCDAQDHLAVAGDERLELPMAEER